MEPSNQPDLPEALPVFSLTRETVTIGDLISKASDAWRRDVGTWALAIILAVLIGYGIPLVLGLMVAILGGLFSGGAEPHPSATALVKGLQIGVQILQTVIQGVLTMGLWAMAIHALHGRPAPIGALFSQIHKALKYVLQVLAIWVPLAALFALIGVAVFFAFVGPLDLDMGLDEAFQIAAPALGVFLLVSAPVYVYVILGILFAQTELTYNDDSGPIEAVIYSWRIAKKNRWLILGVAIISGLIALGSLMLCGVGFLFGGPFATLILAALYLALRNGADVPAPDTGSTLGRRY